MPLPPLSSSSKITAEDCKDPYKLSKLLQAMSQGAVRATQSHNQEIRRVSEGLARVESSVVQIEDTSGLTVLRTIDAIDLTSAAGTTLFTVGSGSFHPLGFSIRFTAVSSVSVAPVVGIGTSSSTTEIFAPRTLHGTLAVDEGPTFFPSGYRPTLKPGDSAFFVVTSAATATTLTASVDLIGYEL